MKLDTPPYETPMDQNGVALTWPWLQWLQKLVLVVRNLIGPLGGQYIYNPHGLFYSTANQTLSLADTPTKITLNTVDMAYGCTMASSTITATVSGMFAYYYSLQLANPSAQIQEASVWLKKNGTDVVGSGSKFDVVSQHGGSDGYLLAESTFMLPLVAGDTIDLYWACTDATVNLEAYAAQTVPYARPTVPSVVVMMHYVSAM